MSRKFQFIIIFPMLLAWCLAQDSTAIKDTLNTVKIYENLYNTASRDKKIKEDEKAMLRSLQRSLHLNKYQAKDIETRLSLQHQNVLDQSGRWPLVLQNIAWGAGLYGWGIPYLLHAEDSKWIVASELMSFAGSFYLTYKYTKNMDIPHSRAQMMRTGSLIGYHYGWSLGKALRLNFGMEEDNRAWVGLLMASVPAGIWLGDRLNSRWQPTNGQAWAISLTALMGTAMTTNLHGIIKDKPGEPECLPVYNPELDYWEYNDCENTERYKKYEENLKDWEQIQALMIMAAYPVSLYLGNKIFGEKDYTFGDALLLYQGFGLGTIYSLMFLDVAYGGNIDEEDDIFKIGLMAGGLLGTFAYEKIFSGYDYTFGESILIGAGSLSGGAFGAGIGVVLETDFEFIEIGMIAGGIIGTALTKHILNPEKETRAESKTTTTQLTIRPDFQYFSNADGFYKFLAPGLNLEIKF